ncbi:MAG: hypothetical protein JW856_01320, partial [Dehalococcoidales bacterium]|nr:hypothetical protein [Dehalococcoidales bacterium]
MIPREPEEKDLNDLEIEDSPSPETGQDIEKTLTEAQQKAQDYLDSWKRTQADFINYKRRTEQEKLEMG